MSKTKRRTFIKSLGGALTLPLLESSALGADVDKAILNKSAENEYRIVETISTVVDSPLFRD